jgi:hypothetical protein
MPTHDWTRVDAGTCHDFHQGWTIEVRNRLNGGILPDGYFAMADQRVSGPEPAFGAGEPPTAYVDPVAVGDPLPDAPLFLAPGW